MSSGEHQSQGRLFPKEGPIGGSHGGRRELADWSVAGMLVGLLGVAEVRGIGFKTLQALCRLGLLQNLWDADEIEVMKALRGARGRTPMEVWGEVRLRRAELTEVGNCEAVRLAREGVKFIPRGSKEYPTSLERLGSPPEWLFVKGSVEVMHERAIVGVVGTREPSQEGKELARSCAAALVRRGGVVLSGLARGIDREAHEGATKWMGRTIAVLGQGISARSAGWTKALAEKMVEGGGAVASEYLPDDIPSKDRFLRRNELQAAMVRVLVAVECPSLSSGTGATIRRAMALGTPVVGLAPAGGGSETLRATQQVLSSIGARVFSVTENGASEFWSYLSEVIPEHDWRMQER